MRSSEIRFFTPGAATQMLYREDEFGVPFLPVTKRERGSRWSHGNRTIGGYKRYATAGTDRTITRDNQWIGRWVWTWVDPRHINETMEHFFAGRDRTEKAQAEHQAKLQARLAEAFNKLEATGLSVKEIYKLLGIERLLSGQSTTIYLTADQVIALIESHPLVRQAKVQAEVEEALSLLGAP